MFDPMPLHGLEHARLPCPSSSWSLLKLMSIDLVMPSNHLILCHPLLLLPQSFLASESFPMSQFFPSGGQCIGASASASVLSMNTVNDKLALAGIIANNWTTMAFAICLCGEWTLNPALLQLLTFNTPWESSGWRKTLCAPGNLVGQVFR